MLLNTVSGYFVSLVMKWLDCSTLIILKGTLYIRRRPAYGNHILWTTMHIVLRLIQNKRKISVYKKHHGTFWWKLAGQEISIGQWVCLTSESAGLHSGIQETKSTLATTFWIPSKLFLMKILFYSMRKIHLVGPTRICIHKFMLVSLARDTAYFSRELARLPAHVIFFNDECCPFIFCGCACCVFLVHLMLRKFTHQCKSVWSKKATNSHARLLTVTSHFSRFCILAKYNSNKVSIRFSTSSLGPDLP